MAAMNRGIAAAGLGTATVVLAGLLLIGVVGPGSAPARLIALVLPLPDVAAANYNAALESAAHAPPRAKAALDAAAAEAAVKEVQTAPLKPDSWLRLAYARVLAGPASRAGALDALRRSFIAAPIQASIAAFRDHFALSFWPALTPALRASVGAELAVVWASSPDRRAELTRAVVSVADPEGRAAGEAVLSGAGWSPEGPQ